MWLNLLITCLLKIIYTIIEIGDRMLENMKDMLNKAKDNKYAVAQFNINNLEWTKFILEECQANQSPVILGVSEGAAKYMGGYKTVADMVKNLMAHLNITIPVALHLDHGSSYEVCVEAIDAGFTSVMIDASKYDLDTNVATTKKVVEYAHARNVTVEGEIGHIGGTEDGVTGGILYAEVSDCVEYCTRTGLDFLAPALGSVHGPYKGDPVLAFDRMEEIKNVTGLPLVLHGGTGIYDEQIRKAIECGICKLNINTELQQAWTAGVREKLNSDLEVYDPRKVIKAGEKNIKEAIKTKLELLKTVNIASNN